MKKDSFINHYIVYLFGVFLINAAGYLLIPIYTRYLPTSEFGILEIINRSIEIVNIIFMAGMGITSLSFYSSEEGDERKNTVISTAILSLAVFSFAGFCLLLIITKPINIYLFNNTDNMILFRFASITMVAEILSSVPFAYIRARMKSKLFVILSVVRFLSIILLNITLVVVLQMRITGVVLGNMIGSIIFVLFLLVYTLRRTGLSFDRTIFKKMLSFGLPFVPGGLFLFILNNGDRFFIQNMLDSSVLGIYSLGYKIGTLVMTFVLGPFLRVWGPYMFKLDKESKDRESFGRFFIYITTAYCFASVVLSIFAEEIIKILADRSYIESHKVVPYILAAYLFWSAAAFFDSGFYITRKTKYKLFIMGAATVLSIALYWILIPLYGLLGGAYATVICFGFFSALTYVISNKIYPVRYPIGRFAYALGLAGVIYAASTFIPNTNEYLKITMKLILVISYPLIIITTGVFNSEELNNLKIYLKSIKNKAILTTFK